VVNATPRQLYPRDRPGTRCIGGWAGPRAGLDECGKSHTIGIRSPDRPARSESLYRLRYPGPVFQTAQQNFGTKRFRPLFSEAGYHTLIEITLLPMQANKLASQVTHFPVNHSFKIPRLWSIAISSYDQSYHTAGRKTPEDIPAQ
jgi:hypothetical protein